MTSNDVEGSVSTAEKRSFRVWDVPTRVFHCLLALLIPAAWYTGEESMMERHALVGQAILVLIVFRVIWGLIGSSTAQFHRFLRGPSATLAYARQLFRRPGQRSVGHNPMGGWMVILMLVLVGLQAGFGLVSNNEDDFLFEAPLVHLVDRATSDAATIWHHILFDWLLIAIVVHVVAVLFYLVYKGENLLGAMLTGRKSWTPPLPGIHTAPWWLAIATAVVAVLAVWAIVSLP